MHARRPPEALLAVGAIAAAFALALAAALGVGQGAKPAPAAAVIPSWRGLVGETPTAVSTEQRMIVVLRAPSLADRVAEAGGFATETQERAWTAAAYAVQQQLLTYLALHGTPVHPDYTYARVLNGFAATLDPRAVALLERTNQVEGLYPVRAAYPASLTGTQVATGGSQDATLPGFTGRGVTIALLDTGVDLTHPFLGGHVLPGFDVVDHGSDASARTDPQNAGLVERHGTELAGLLAGSNGPGGLHGVAPGATILPIRVAGWQRDTTGNDVVYARTDQVLAGLDRAVDPNGDGDAHDAVRIALVGVVEPYASFADGVDARAVQSALELNTLVVAPAGNAGPAGPMFGSVGAPAGVPGALAVGSSDGRATTTVVRVVLRRGLDVLFDGEVPLAGAVAPTHSLKLLPAEPHAANGSLDFLDERGSSLVAGRATFAPAGSDPLATALAAAHAGAAAVLLYGSPLPAGSLRAVAGLGIPVVVVPSGPALAVLAAERAGIDSGVSLGPAADVANPSAGHVAPFSSQGLAFDGRVKPDLAAPGVGLATSEPRSSSGRGALYGTISGTSASAATVAGAAALLVQMRPGLDGPALAGLLAGYARAGDSPLAVGAGALDLGASAVGEVTAAPTTLAFGPWGGPKWKSTQTLVVSNVSTRALQISLSAVSGGDSEAFHFVVAPDRLALAPGRSADVSVTVSVPDAPPERIVSGSIVVAPTGGEALRVPWAIAFDQPAPILLAASLDRAGFKPSDVTPAILTVRAGALVARSGRIEVEPVALLDILLYDARGRFVGRLARVRDLLPGSYTFGITGRGPSTLPLPPGRYELRLNGWPTLPENAQPTRVKVRFTIS